MSAADKPDWRRLDSDRAKVLAAHAKPQTERPPEDGVILTCAATLKPEPVRWLWRDWLALGKFHVLAGAPGQGKTTLALAMAAAVTSAGRWPDGSRCDAGSVLMWSGEDDPADTLLPRLVAMGADPARVFFVTGSQVGGEVLPFDPARDMPQLLAEAERIGNVRLLIVDPVVSAVAGDSHKNTEVRRALQPLVDLGASLGAAVLGISHFSKGSNGRDPTERVVGSMAFGAVARVVLCAAKVKGQDGGEDRRVLVRSKSNIGPDDGGFEYAIAQMELDAWPGVHASLIEWGQAVDGTARELLAEAEADQGDDVEASAFDDACGFLRHELANGPKSAKYIFAEARQAGHSERTIKRAKAHLGIESRKEAAGWLWGMSAEAEAKQGKDAKGAKDSTSENLGTVGTLGTVDHDIEVF
jgi:putative DNA primase/helicase